MTNSGPGAACPNAVADCCSALSAQGVTRTFDTCANGTYEPHVISLNISIAYKPPSTGKKNGAKNGRQKKRSLLFFWMDVYICLNITSVSLTSPHLQEIKKNANGHIECAFLFFWHNPERQVKKSHLILSVSQTGATKCMHSPQFQHCSPALICRIPKTKGGGFTKIGNIVIVILCLCLDCVLELHYR